MAATTGWHTAAQVGGPPAVPPPQDGHRSARLPAMATGPEIADRGEFIDVLNLLRKGRLLVRSDLAPDRCLIDHGVVYHAFDTLSAYGLLEEMPPPPGAATHAPHLHWYRLTPQGHAFAQRAWSEWRRRPLWQRCLIRVLG